MIWCVREPAEFLLQNDARGLEKKCESDSNESILMYMQVMDTPILMMEFVRNELGEFDRVYLSLPFQCGSFAMMLSSIIGIKWNINDVPSILTPPTENWTSNFP